MAEKTEEITLGDRIGSGGFGEVYRTTIDGVPRAIKCVKLNKNPIEDEMKSAREELEVLQRLKSEHVVAVFGLQVNRRAQCAMIIMEYMEGGGSLEKLIKGNPLVERDVIFYLGQILRGVAFMHENHVVHRDLKPANFLLDKTGNLKICDLGVAKVIRTIRSDRGMKTWIGTIRYTAPEVFKAGYGNKADIWSVGASVVHMITGEMPYPELQEDLQVVFNVGNGNAKYDLQGMATTQMDDFVGRLMKFECTDRPHAPDALERLEQLQTENNTEQPCVAFEDTGAVARPTNSNSARLSKRLKNSNLARPAARYSEVERRNERMQSGPGTDDRMETRWTQWTQWFIRRWYSSSIEGSEDGAAKGGGSGILTTGGYGSGRSMEIYSLATNTSRILPTAMREDRRGHVSGMLRDGRVMLAGGWNSDARALSSTELIDPVTLQPTPGRPMNTARKYASSAVLNGDFYVGGGGDEKGNILSSCEQFRDGEWMRIPDMQEARLGHAMVAVGKYIYAIGGEEKNDDALDSVERYCPETDTWQIVTYSNYKRDHLAAAECNGCIYVCGGWDENYKPLRICERYSPIANRWQRMADLNLARSDFCLVSVGGKLCEKSRRLAFATEPSIRDSTETFGYQYSRENSITRTLLRDDLGEFMIVPGSQSQSMNKDRFCRLLHNPELFVTFEEYKVWLHSHQLVTMTDSGFSCSCAIGHKEYMCKHIVAAKILFYGFQVKESISSRPLGQKRTPGRPRQVRGALEID